MIPLIDIDIRRRAEDALNEDVYSEDQGIDMVVEELLWPLVNTDGPIEGTIAPMPCKE